MQILTFSWYREFFRCICKWFELKESSHMLPHGCDISSSIFYNFPYDHYSYFSVIMPVDWYFRHATPSCTIITNIKKPPKQISIEFTSLAHWFLHLHALCSIPSIYEFSPFTSHGPEGSEVSTKNESHQAPLCHFVLFSTLFHLWDIFILSDIFFLAPFLVHSISQRCALPGPHGYFVKDVSVSLLLTYIFMLFFECP